MDRFGNDAMAKNQERKVNKMANDNMNSGNLVAAAVAGGALGAVAALLMAPKAGTRLRRDICDMYDDVTEKTHDMAHDAAKKSKSAMKNMSCHTSSWFDKAKCAVDDAKCWTHCDEDTQLRDLVIGGVSGVLIGAAAGLFLAPKSGFDLRQEISDTYEGMNARTQDMVNSMSKKGKSVAKDLNSTAQDWLHLAKAVVDQIAGDAQDAGEELLEKGKHILPNNKLNDVMDWAALGFRLWQNMKKRR